MPDLRGNAYPQSTDSLADSLACLKREEYTEAVDRERKQNCPHLCRSWGQESSRSKEASPTSRDCKKGRNSLAMELREC